MNIEEYRHDKTLVQNADRVLALPEVRLMLDTLWNSAPFNYMVTGGLTPADHSLQLGRCEGYLCALRHFESLGKLTGGPPKAVQATFAAPKPSTPKE